jgi:3',5'-cyclic AMP phosphodiesterase CpdA
VRKGLAGVAVACIVLASVAEVVLGSSSGPSWSGSTLQATWIDPTGSGVLERGPAEPLLDRIELAPRSRPLRPLVTFVQISDSEITDAKSPARLEMLDRFGPPFTSAFRPQETLTGQVLAASIAAIDRLAPQAVVLTGDLIASDQQNELDELLAVLRGGRVDPDSGGPGYQGVQAASNPDPYYYRPQVDPPRHPGLLAEAEQPFVSPGLRARWYPLVGDHDLLVQGNLPPSAQTNRIATGDRKLVTLDRSALALAREHLLDPRLVERLLARGLPGQWIHVTADPRRRELSSEQVLSQLRQASRIGGTAPRLDYTFPLGPRVLGVALDTVDRAGGSEGVLEPRQVAWLKRELRAAGTRPVIVFSHSALTSAHGGAAALALLDHDPHVVAAVSGSSHRNSITPRHTPAGGYWLISTASLIDYPQQARAFRLLTNANGGLVLQTWMVDPDPRYRLASIALQLSYLDFQGGRPQHFAGAPGDRNASLYWR